MKFGEIFGRKHEKQPAVIGHRKIAQDLLVDLVREYKDKEEPTFTRAEAEKLFAQRNGLHADKLDSQQRQEVSSALRELTKDPQSEIRDLGYMFAFPKNKETQH